MPKKTIQAIVDSGNEYVIQVKKNQKSLWQEVNKTIMNGFLIDANERKEVNRGREEHRRVRVYRNDSLFISQEWQNVNRIIEVINQGTRSGKMYFETHYYISSLKMDRAEIFAKGIRQHWSIENKLHWVKDVIQNEDNNLIEEKRIASNLSLIKSIVISVFRVNGYQSIKHALERYKNRISDCGALIGIKSI